MTLTENVTYDQRGWPMENSLMQYKIPTRVDVGKVRVEFENSYEPNGPFGAKSIGEVVINTPLPAISDAIYNAIGTRFYELPITPEKSQWQWPKQRVRSDDRPRGSAIPRRNGTRYFSGGRRRKTTLLYALARWYSTQGQRVLVSTTTHIQRPDANYAPMRRRGTPSGRLVLTPWRGCLPKAGS